DHWQIWRWQVQGGQGAPLTVPDPLGTATSNNVAPSVSPDGTSVAFLTDRTGKWELWVMNADGSNQRPLAPDALAGVNFRYDFNSDRTVDWGL
ncbi:MAG: PD40 domain-containing protein, partial [Anaerolineae bacterium]|nr:PD40 domain-containing protein [Anaerolineae bacterium]